MMTEERIKELKKWHIGSDEDVEALIRIVAVEGREEGIESVKLNSIVRITKHKERCSESGYSFGEFTEGLEVGIKVITEEAKRLKEEG